MDMSLLISGKKKLCNGIIDRETKSQIIDELIPKKPKSVKIELSSICNFKCKICFNRFSTRKSLMNEEDFQLALDNVSEFGIEQVGLLYLGESTLNPNIIKYIKLTKEKNIPYVFLTTNGMFDESLLEKLVNSGLDSLKWSINYNHSTFSEETGLNEGIDIILNNIKNAYLIRKEKNIPIMLYASTVVKDLNNIDVELKDFLEENVIPYVDEHIFNKETNQGGCLNNGICSNITDNLIPCPRLFNNTYITSDLDVTCCCYGFTEDFKIGNLKEKRLKDIWFNDIITDLREKHLNNNLEHTICYTKAKV